MSRTLGIFVLKPSSEVQDEGVSMDEMEKSLQWWSDKFRESSAWWIVKRLNEESFVGISTFATCDSLLIWSSPYDMGSENDGEDDVAALVEFLELQSLLPPQERTIPILSYGYAANRLVLEAFSMLGDEAETPHRGPDTKPYAAVASATIRLKTLHEYFGLETTTKASSRFIENYTTDEVKNVNEDAPLVFLSHPHSRFITPPTSAATTITKSSEDRLEWPMSIIMDPYKSDDASPLGCAIFESRRRKFVGIQFPSLYDVADFIENRIAPLLESSQIGFEEASDAIRLNSELIQSQDFMLSLSIEFLTCPADPARGRETLERRMDYLINENERLRCELQSRGDNRGLKKTDDGNNSHVPLALRLLMCDLPSADSNGSNDEGVVIAKLVRKERERATMFPLGPSGEGGRAPRCESSVIYAAPRDQLNKLAVVALVSCRLSTPSGGTEEFVLFSCSDKTLRVVDLLGSSSSVVEDSAEILMRCQMPIVRLAFDATDAVLAVSCLDGCVELFSVLAKQQAETCTIRLESRCVPLAHHKKYSTGMAFNSTSSPSRGKKKKNEEEEEEESKVSPLLLAIAGADSSYSVVEARKGVLLRHVPTARVVESLGFLMFAFEEEEKEEEALAMFIRETREMVLLRSDELANPVTAITTCVVPISFKQQRRQNGRRGGGAIEEEDDQGKPRNILSIATHLSIPNVVAIATDDSTLCLLDLRTGSLLLELQNGFTSDGFTRAVCKWSGKYVLVCDGREVCVWDVAFPQRPRWRSGDFSHSKAVKCVDLLLSNGEANTRFVTGGVDGVIGVHTLFDATG